MLMYIVLFVIALVFVYFLFFTDSGKKLWCPTCGKALSACQTCPDCPSCLMTSDMAKKILQQISQGCVNRLVRVQRESQASKEELQEFMVQGNNRLAVVTNVSPGGMVSDIANNPNSVTAVSMSTSIANGQKQFMVMVMGNGLLNPVNLSTPNFDAAFKSFANFVRATFKDNEVGTLVFFMDEDIPCVGPLPQPVPMPKKEKCCGSKHY